jgi:hypothetical protein
MIQFEGSHHARHGMLGQELQNADVLAGTDLRCQPVLQALAHLGEERRQLPISENIGMVQRRRPSSQTGQVVQRLQDLFVLTV